MRLISNSGYEEIRCVSDVNSVLNVRPSQFNNIRALSFLDVLEFVLN